MCANIPIYKKRLFPEGYADLCRLSCSETEKNAIHSDAKRLTFVAGEKGSLWYAFIPGPA